MTSSASPANGRANAAVLVQQRMRLLDEHTRTLRSLDEIVARNAGMSENPSMLPKVWDPINRFTTAAEATIKRIERMDPDWVRLHPTTAVGFFEKQLRRLRVAQSDLRRASKSVMFAAASLRKVQFDRDSVIDTEDLPEFLIQRDYRRYLKELTAEALDRMIRAEVPAILACQETVFCALVVTISSEFALFFGEQRA